MFNSKPKKDEMLCYLGSYESIGAYYKDVTKKEMNALKRVIKYRILPDQISWLKSNYEYYLESFESADVLTKEGLDSAGYFKVGKFYKLFLHAQSCQRSLNELFTSMRRQIQELHGYDILESQAFQCFDLSKAS